MAAIQTNFTANDMITGAPAEPELRKAKKVAPEPQAIQAAAQESRSIDTWTVQEVNDWVGDDKARAQQALQAELKTAAPRKSLVAALQKRVR